MRLSTLVLVSLVTLSGCMATARPALVGPAVMSAPPPDRVEVVGVAPSPAHVWVRGHWAWRGAWVWNPGVWVVGRPGYSFVAGRWVQRGRGRIWVEGRWVRL
jgi:hypothetical protein